MDQRQPYWTDERLENIVGSLLRFGVVLSAAVVLLGAVLYLTQQGSRPAEIKTFDGEPARLRHISEIVANAPTLTDGEAVIQFGLLLLLATPVARVVLCVVVFAVQRDRLYVVVTLVVLALLLFSLIGVR